MVGSKWNGRLKGRFGREGDGQRESYAAIKYEFELVAKRYLRERYALLEGRIDYDYIEIVPRPVHCRD